MTKKDVIKNWIIMKIIIGEWKNNHKLPSENQLSKQFNSSRNPVRAALKELTYSDWISVKKGSCYFVSGEGNYQSLYAKGAFKINKTNIRDLTKKEHIFIKNFIVNKIESPVWFVKEYFRNNKMILKTFNLTNNDYLFHLNNSEIEQSYIQGLISHKIPITHQKRELKFILDKKISKEFNWNNFMPVIHSKLFIADKLIESSLILIQKNHFKFEYKILF